MIKLLSRLAEDTTLLLNNSLPGYDSRKLRWGTNNGCNKLRIYIHGPLFFKVV